MSERDSSTGPQGHVLSTGEKPPPSPDFATEKASANFDSFDRICRNIFMRPEFSDKYSTGVSLVTFSSKWGRVWRADLTGKPMSAAVEPLPDVRATCWGQVERLGLSIVKRRGLPALPTLDQRAAGVASATFMGGYKQAGMDEFRAQNDEAMPPVARGFDEEIVPLDARFDALCRASSLLKSGLGKGAVVGDVQMTKSPIWGLVWRAEIELQLPSTIANPENSLSLAMLTCWGKLRETPGSAVGSHDVELRQYIVRKGQTASY